MKVIVEKNFSHDKPWELEEYIKLTRNFSKRFYKITYRQLTAKIPLIMVHAIAISRDMVYSMRMTLDCQSQIHYSGEPEHEWERPAYGLIPLNDDCAEVFFPNMRVANTHYPYMNVFDKKDFTLVQELEFDVPREKLFKP